MGKLVEILAKELEEWPSGENFLTQSRFDNEIYGCDSEGYDEGYFGIYVNSHHTEDEVYPVVSKQEWEAARNKDKVMVIEVGDKVKIRKDSKFYGTSSVEVVGIVAEVYCEGSHYPVLVEWAEGYVDSYQFSDLELVTSCSAPDDTHLEDLMEALDEFNPVAIRNRIYEIDKLALDLMNERKTLIKQLKDEGFVLSQEVTMF